jgi:hypothetical protein
MEANGNGGSLSIFEGFLLLPFGDRVITIGSWAIFFFFARFFFSQWLFRDYEIKSWTTQVRMIDSYYNCFYLYSI